MNNVNEFSSENLKKSVMRRVVMVYWLRRLFGPLGIKVGLLLVLAVLETYFVSVPSVITNFSGAYSSPGAAYDFLISAFKNTQFTVQIISGAILIAVFFFIRDLVKWSGFTLSSLTSRN